MNRLDSEPGYSIIRSEQGNAARCDPVARAWLRYDELEYSSRPGLRMPDGTYLKLDAKERRVLGKGVAQVDAVTYRVAAALHMRHRFQHFWAVDGSKASLEVGGGAAYGGWRGPKQVARPERQERDDEREEAARWGVMGASLPAGFETDDAECYAILRAMKEVCQRTEEEGGDLSEQRLIILSDCAPVVSQVEKAYREGTAEGLRATATAHILT